MKLKKASLKILANKPDIFASLPPDVLEKEAAERLCEIPRLAVAEIAGPADMQALRDLLPRYKPDGLLPTFSYTGTEFGDWERLADLASELKDSIEKKLHIYTADPVVLGAPALWKALRQVHEGELATRFGFASPCLGCRLYSFMLRVPLCKKVDARFFIPSLSGLVERRCPPHGLTVEKKYFSFLMSGYGIEVWHQGLTLEEPDGTGACLSCVLSGNHDHSAPPEKLVRYFENFALPAAGGILSHAVFGAQVDYGKSFAEFLKPQPEIKKKPRAKKTSRYR